MAPRITCPHCGERASDEWVHGEMFDLPDALTDTNDRDIDRGYFHNNTEGVVTEAWFHLFGCRRWIVVQRDTRTDTFL